MLKIALVGAPGSGKAVLAAALTDALNASGWPAAIVSIDNPALAPELASHDLILLMGLDIGSTARLAQEAADQQIRAALAHANIAYPVIYGLGEERLHHAIQACKSLLKQDTQLSETTMAAPPASVEAGKKARQWVWMCEKCSDPACEHRLLSDLLASRGAAGASLPA